jgi:putative PIN family toxin of toxin-antitoxin system
LKILVDTNILISALFYPASVPAKALFYAANIHTLVLTDYNIAELKRIAESKFKARKTDVNTFLNGLKYILFPVKETPQHKVLISDPKDAPILNAAIAADVDIIISGDKHFLSVNLERPRIMTAADYLKLNDK